MWITISRDDAGRFIDGVVDLLLRSQRNAINVNLDQQWIDAGAQFGNNFAIDHHPAGFDQLFALTPTPKTGRSQ